MSALRRLRLMLLIPLFATLLLADEAGKGKMKISTFAPAKVTESQLETFLGKISNDLSEKADYGEAEQQRVNLDASTVAVLALMLGHHDEETKLKQSASELIRLAGELAESADDFDASKAKLGELKKALASHPQGEAVTWDEPVADLSMLMKQVPIVNAPLRTGVSSSRRFKRSAPKLAGTAVTLAAIAQASMMDTSYCADEEDEKAWKQICADMRDACADVFRALMEKDQAKAKAGNARVVETCDACHHKFRD